MTYKVQARGENGAVAVIVDDEAQAREKAQELREAMRGDVSVEPALASPEPAGSVRDADRSETA